MQEIPSFTGPPRTSPWTLESSHPEGLSGVDFPLKQSRIPVAFEHSQYGFQWDYRIPENATDHQHWNPLQWGFIPLQHSMFSGSLFSIWGFHRRIMMVTLWLCQTVCEFENGPVEIVDFPIFSHEKWWIFPVLFWLTLTRPGKRMLFQPQSAVPRNGDRKLAAWWSTCCWNPKILLFFESWNG